MRWSSSFVLRIALVVKRSTKLMPIDSVPLLNKLSGRLCKRQGVDVFQAASEQITVGLAKDLTTLGSQFGWHMWFEKVRFLDRTEEFRECLLIFYSKSDDSSKIFESNTNFHKRWRFESGVALVFLIQRDIRYIRFLSTLLTSLKILLLMIGFSHSDLN